jgi:two-component system, LytTR family, response regulator
MRLRAYLVDDEPLALARLTRLLDATGRVDVVGSTTEPEEAVDVLTREPPDVCFLDVQMPRLNGFEVLARLPQQPIVVFTTAYDQYALKAFAVNSVDYLLKPVEAGDLERALAKIERLSMAGALSALSATALGGLVKTMAESLRDAQPRYLERISSRLGERLRFIDLATVTHFFAEDKLTYASVGGKAHCVDYSIAELERRLDPRHFLRIHRATLVNLAYVAEAAPLPGGGLALRLEDDARTQLTVSRDRARLVKARLGA